MKGTEIVKMFKIDLEQWVVAMHVDMTFLRNARSLTFIEDHTTKALRVQLKTALARCDKKTERVVDREWVGTVKEGSWNWFKASLKICPYLPNWITKRIKVEYRSIHTTTVNIITRRICPHTHIEGDEKHLSFLTNEVCDGTKYPHH